jgi:hypothetical protein
MSICENKLKFIKSQVDFGASVSAQSVQLLLTEIELLTSAQARRDDQNFNAKQLLTRAAKVLGLDTDNTSWFEVVGEMEKASLLEEDSPCQEADGCPTEGAVLKRFWRAHQQSQPVGYRCAFKKEPDKWMHSWDQPLPKELNPFATYELLYSYPLPTLGPDPVSWGAPKTVHELVRQLLTLDQNLEPKTMHRIPNYKDGNQVKAYHLSISNERVDGTGDFLVPCYKKAVANGEGRQVLAFWTKPDPRLFTVEEAE